MSSIETLGIEAEDDIYIYIYMVMKNVIYINLGIEAEDDRYVCVCVCGDEKCDL